MLDHLQRRERITKRKRETLGAGHFLRAYSTAAAGAPARLSRLLGLRAILLTRFSAPLLDQTGGEKAAPALAEPSVLLNGE
jgi:hypothetical protein